MKSQSSVNQVSIKSQSRVNQESIKNQSRVNQYNHHDQVFAEVKINGETMYKKKNSNPLQFYEVEVYVGNYNLPANANIKNIILESFDL